MKIFVTGGTGFIGKTLVRHLVESGHEVRLLIRPSKNSPNVPRGVPVEIAVSSISDPRGLRSAMLGVDVVFHLAGAERHGAYADLMNVDIKGTQLVSTLAKELKIKRVFFLSHLGAERYSAFPISKAKALGEEALRASGVDYTIFRSGIIFGEGDHFTSGIAYLLAAIPFVFIMPGDGRTMLQPLWVEDLATVLTWSLDDPSTINQTFEIGGPELLPFEEIVQLVMETIRLKKRIIHIPPPFLRGITVFLETTLPKTPVSVFWLDYLATNHTCAIDTLPRVFNLLPSRLSQQIHYLEKTNWRKSLWKNFIGARRT
ncbi:MAG: SDR family oxidoreductase [Anaerolineales bacterium]